MTAVATRSFVSGDEAFTETIGALLAQTVPPAVPRALSVHLCGDLGGVVADDFGKLRALGLDPVGQLGLAHRLDLLEVFVTVGSLAAEFRQMPQERGAVGRLSIHGTGSLVRP